MFLCALWLRAAGSCWAQSPQCIRTKTPTCEIPSPTANWDTRLIFTTGEQQHLL